MKIIQVLFLLICIPLAGSAQGDWIIVSSDHSIQKTVETLQQTIEAKGFKVFNVIDHAKGAESAGLTLRPTTLIIFGNPKGGTPLMNCDQRMGIILPLKILVWENESKQVKAGFINPEKLSTEYDLEKCKDILSKMKNALQGLLSSVEKK
jgi:uncharacterized protein (DUF302 family)